MPSARASTPASRPSRPTHAASAASQIIEQGSSFIARNSTCSQSFLLQPPTKKPEEPNECSPEISGDRIGARSLLHLARRSIGGSARAGRCRGNYSRVFKGEQRLRPHDNVGVLRLG